MKINNHRNSTDLCLLCKSNPADKRNSHIVSLFIIANMLNETGDARDQEIMGTIGSGILPKTYLGRSITPEKIDELYGRQLSDDEIELNVNPCVEDYILCTHCEERLQRIEDLVSREIYGNINQIETIHEGQKQYKMLSNYKYNLLKFFFFSIVWRASISKTVDFYSFSLCDSFEEKLRIILHDNLSLDIAELNTNLENLDNQLVEFPVLMFCQSNTNDGSSKIDNFVSFYPFSVTPYYAVINEFVLCLYYKHKSLNHKPTKFFGIEKLFDSKELRNERNLKSIRILNADEWNNWRNKILPFVHSETLLNIRNLFYDLHEHFYGCKPTKGIADGFINRMIRDDEEGFGKYTMPHFINVALEYFEYLATNQIPILN